MHQKTQPSQIQKLCASQVRQFKTCVKSLQPINQSCEHPTPLSRLSSKEIRNRLSQNLTKLSITLSQLAPQDISQALTILAQEPNFIANVMSNAIHCINNKKIYQYKQGNRHTQYSPDAQRNALKHWITQLLNDASLAMHILQPDLSGYSSLQTGLWHKDVALTTSFLSGSAIQIDHSQPWLQAAKQLDHSQPWMKKVPENDRALSIAHVADSMITALTQNDVLKIPQNTPIPLTSMFTYYRTKTSSPEHHATASDDLDLCKKIQALETILQSFIETISLPTLTPKTRILIARNHPRAIIQALSQTIHPNQKKGADIARENMIPLLAYIPREQQYDLQGWTLLHISTAYNNIPILKLLMQQETVRQTINDPPRHSPKIRSLLDLPQVPKTKNFLLKNGALPGPPLRYRDVIRQTIARIAQLLMQQALPDRASTFALTSPQELDLLIENLINFNRCTDAHLQRLSDHVLTQYPEHANVIMATIITHLFKMPNDSTQHAHLTTNLLTQCATQHRGQMRRTIALLDPEALQHFIGQKQKLKALIDPIVPKSISPQKKSPKKIQIIMSPSPHNQGSSPSKKRGRRSSFTSQPHKPSIPNQTENAQLTQDKTKPDARMQQKAKFNQQAYLAIARLAANNIDRCYALLKDSSHLSYAEQASVIAAEIQSLTTHLHNICLLYQDDPAQTMEKITAWISHYRETHLYLEQQEQMIFATLIHHLSSQATTKSATKKFLNKKIQELCRHDDVLKQSIGLALFLSTPVSPSTPDDQPTQTPNTLPEPLHEPPPPPQSHKYSALGLTCVLAIQLSCLYVAPPLTIIISLLLTNLVMLYYANTACTNKRTHLTTLTYLASLIIVASSCLCIAYYCGGITAHQWLLSTPWLIGSNSLMTMLTIGLLWWDQPNQPIEQTPLAAQQTPISADHLPQPSMLSQDYHCYFGASKTQEHDQPSSCAPV
jgi:hypothetical protein